jgi:membrane protease YdiL (CAAX protease family)
MAQTARRTRFWGVPEFTTGLAVTLILMWLLVTWMRSASFPVFALGGNLALLLSYLVVWIPLLAACAFATYRRGTLSPRRDLGLAVTGTDVLFGLSVGLLVRGIVSALEIATTGRLSLGSVTFGNVVYNGWWVFAALLAPIVLAPFVEELFFRGLVLRSVQGWLTGITVGRPAPRSTPQSTHRLASGTAILISASLFALLHMTQASSPSSTLMLGASTLILGIAAGILAVMTGRIGASIVAHATFNATIIVSVLTA